MSSKINEKMSFKIDENQPVKLYRHFHCSSCDFQFFIKDFTLKGLRCPMLLHCGHSVCNFCLQHSLKSTKSITCKLCGFAYSLEPSEPVTDCFSLNNYVLGSLVALHNYRLEKDKILTFLAKNNFNYAILGESNTTLKTNSSTINVCEECSLEASWHCENCKSNFCNICWSKVHGSAKSLTKHFKTAISEFTRTAFKKCKEHENQDLEFFCKDCSTTVCSHCVILQHQGENHHSITLKEKNLEIINEVKTAVLDASKISKRMKQTLEKIKTKQSPLKTLENKSFSDFGSQITRNFSRIHGILQLEEERLLKRLHKKSSEHENSLRALQSQLEKQIEVVENLLRECDFAVMKPQNSDLTDLYRQLKEVQNLPCYLISKKSDSEEAKLVFDEKVIDLVRLCCTMDLPSDELLELRSSSDLPEDYVIEPLSTSDLDQNAKKSEELSTFSKPEVHTLTNWSSLEQAKEDLISPLPRLSKNPNVFFERKSYCVRVSFIKNPGEFYVILNSQRSKLKAIDGQASLLARLSSTVPQSYEKDNIYLVKYNVDQKWYRGRVMEVFPSEKMEGKESVLVYYLDYGNFEVVPISKLRPIPPDLLEEPPLAIKCKLFDCVPRNGEWCTESSRTMEKILKNHTATMFVMKVHKDCLEVDLSVVYPEGQIGRDIVSVRDALLFLEFSSFVHGFKVPRSTTAFKYLDQCFPSAGEIFDVVVTHVNSPSDFYVQKTNQDASLYTLAIDLQNYYEENPEKGMIYNPIIDMPCAALFSADQRWYRAKIVDVPGRKMVTVFYVDYGNKETLQWTGIRKLKECFAKFPPLAMNCTLAGIYPVDGEPWSIQAKSYLKKNILMRVGRIFVQGKSKSKSKLRVLLYKNGIKKDVCLNALFVEKGFAVKSNNSDFLGTLNSWEEEEENLALKTDEKNPSIKKEIDQATLDTQMEFLKNEDFKDQGKTKPKAEELLQIHESGKKIHLENPPSSECGENKNVFKIKVEVLRAETPSSIYVTLFTLKEEFEKLQAKLNDFYENSTDPVKEWTVGSMCAVFDSAKHSWYRACVMETLPNGRVQVFLKDIARVSTEPVSALRILDPSFNRYSACAVKCHLVDVKPCGAQWPTISSEYLVDELDNHKEVYMTKRGQIENGSLPVELWIQKVVSGGALEPITKEWVTLNRLLVNQGLAIPMKAELWYEWEISNKDDKNSEEEKTLDNIQIASTEPSLDKRDLMGVSDTSELFVPSTSSEWIPPVPLKQSSFIGIPTYVDFNAFIYMYDAEQDEENLKTIRDVLLKEFENSEADLEDSFWVPGQLCIAKYHLDNSWYRGLILKENEDITYDVLFVDYGNIETCRASGLRKKIKMHDIPILTHKFQLQGIVTASEDGKWSTTALDTLHSLIVDKKCEVNILKCPLHPNEPYTISLKVVESDVEVGTFMVNKNLAVFDVSDNEILPSHNGFLLMSSEPVDELDKSRYIPLIIPDNCNDFFIEVTTLSSAREFFANIVVDESLPSSLKSALNEFKSLQQKLMEECHLQPPVEKLIKGHPCCCLNFINNEWCRGEVESVIRSGNSVCVRYVDYGKKGFLHKSFVRECKVCWMDLPKMAVKFRLGNVEKCVHVTESAFRKALICCLNERPLFAEILNKHEHFLEVRLLTKRNGSLAYQEMIDKGLMKFI